MYLSGSSASLTDAVQTTLNGHELSGEQKRRITEMTNRLTWQELYAKSDDKTIQFDPANVDTILGEYAAPRPTVTPTGPLDSKPAGPFLDNPVSAESAMATSTVSLLDRPGQIVGVAEQTKVAAEHARANKWRALGIAQRARDTFVEQVVQARHTNEASGKEILVAVSAATSDMNSAKSLIKEAFERVREVGLEPDLDRALPPLYLVDREHPILKALEAYEDATYDLQLNTNAAAILEKQATQVMEEALPYSSSRMTRTSRRPPGSVVLSVGALALLHEEPSEAGVLHLVVRSVPTLELVRPSSLLSSSVVQPWA
jgi:hypothetical protein